jgi:hypothetical protein
MRVHPADPLPAAKTQDGVAPPDSDPRDGLIALARALARSAAREAWAATRLDTAPGTAPADGGIDGT